MKPQERLRIEAENRNETNRILSTGNRRPDTVNLATEIQPNLSNRRALTARANSCY